MKTPLLTALLIGMLAGGGTLRSQEPVPDRLQPAAWLHEDLPVRLRLRMHITRSEPAFRSGGGESGPARPVQRGPAGLGSELATGSPALTFVLLISLCALIFAAVVLYLLRTSSKPDEQQTGKRPPRHDHMKEGDTALAGGDCERALRAFYRHGVYALVTSGVIPTAEHLGDAMIARRLDDQLRSPFTQLSRHFQPMRYGARKVSEDVARDARVAATDLARVAFRAEPESNHAPA